MPPAHVPIMFKKDTTSSTSSITTIFYVLCFRATSGDQSSSQAREHQHRGRRNEERSATSSNRKYGRKSQSQVNTFFDPTIKPRKNEVPKAADFPSLLNDSADVSLLLQPSEGGDMSFVDLSAGASGGAENANATTTNSTAAAAEGGAGGTTWAARLRSATTGTNLEAEGRRDRAGKVLRLCGLALGLVHSYQAEFLLLVDQVQAWLCRR